MTTDEKFDLLLQRIQSIDDRIQSMDDRMQTMDTELQAVKKQGQENFQELMKVEAVVVKLQDDVKDLNVKYDTLLLKSDNTELLLKLINRQSDEMAELKSRVGQLEKRLA